MKIVSCVLLLAALTLVNAKQFIGCGGSISAKEAGNVDLSMVRITLTKQRSSSTANTEADPFGAWFLPIDEDGTYTITPTKPEGWSFEPKSVTITVSKGEVDNAECKEGKDIVFSLKGFALSGHVDVSELNCGSLPSFQDVTVHLGKDKLILAKTQVDAQGHFSFHNIATNSYVIDISHPSWTFAKTIEHVVVSTTQTPPVVFKATGFSIQGKCLFENNAPAKGAKVHLSGGAEITQSIEDDGSFSFSNIKCGKYALSISYNTAETSFDVEPSQMEVSVSQGSAIISKPFIVKGFSITGKVLDLNGEPVENALIEMDGKVKSSSQKDGSFSFSKVSTGSHVFIATKQNMKFEKVTASVSPSRTAIPHIISKSFDVCGNIKFSKIPSGFSLTPKVALFRVGNDKQNLIEVDAVASTSSAMVFHYCIPVSFKPSDLAIKPIIPSNAIAKGISVFPHSIQIQNEAIPQSGVDFTQSTYTISVSVKFPEKMCRDLAVSLNYKGSAVPLQSQTVGCQNNKITFDDVSPMAYVVSVEENAFCWDSPSKEIVLNSNTELSFTSSGLKVIAQSFIQNIEAFLTCEGSSCDSKENKISFSQGKASVCLPLGSSDAYFITATSSCFILSSNGKYSLSPSTILSSGKPQIVSIEAEKTIMHGEVTIPSSHDISSIELSVNKETTVVATKKSAQVYAYSLNAAPGSKLTISPKTTGILKFYPESVTVTVPNGGECAKNIPQITSRLGVFLSGSTTPPSQDADVTVSVENGPIALTSKTDSDGKFKVGPLDDATRYSVSLAKDGFSFSLKAGTTDTFEVVKLTSLVINVRDENGPLPGAFIMVSGSGFRSEVKDTEGKVILRKLASGDYYVKANLKEYSFVSPAQSVTIAPESDGTVDFVAKRIAFSVFGTVKSLDGRPASGVMVAAKSADQFEEVTTDANGNFRIRGLRPGTSYTVTSVPGSGLISSLPLSFSIPSMPSDDVKNVSLIALLGTSGFRVSGHADSKFESEHKDRKIDMKVEMCSKGRPCHTATPLPNTNFVEFNEIPQGEYTVRAICTSYSFRCKSTEDAITVGPSTSPFKVSCTCSPYSNSSELTNVPIASILLLISLVVGFVFREKVISVARKLMGKEVEVIQPKRYQESSFLPSNLLKQKRN
eukprot:TRINITY_DN20072_c0_g1_i1.p1 TRINITY_DN20072_c0_g1~~TRINITY_DN20072_c0_g1_i1.p1  ORF type:complete len:1142 (-),score=355.75 TRINITY_DN20072_c0_g1_i1:22-3447(-)